MSKINYLTKLGYEKMKAELHDLKTRGRDEAAQAIAEAREKGDLSENAEYDAAKDAQGMLELKINELEKAFSNARILDADDIDTSKVGVMCKVTIRNTKTKKNMTYTLVSENEANLKDKKISVDSPIAKGLLGKKVGDVANVHIPAGEVEFEILEITV